MKHLLTVDDSRALRAMVKKALGGHGFELEEAEDGEKGLAAIENREPDLILLDVTMPVMDGPTMLKELRARGYQTKVLLLTAESKLTIISGMMKDGISDYIVKPFQSEELEAKALKILDLKPRGEPVAPVPVVEITPPATSGDAASFIPAEGRPFVGVLLVDDMPNVGKRLRQLLPEHVSLHCCTSAKDAIAHCRSSVYRAVVVDTELPDVETTSLLRQLRALQPSAAFVALVMRTTKDPVRTSREMGFEGILVKPFDQGQLDDFLAAYFETQDVLSVEDNLVTLAAFSGPQTRQSRYFSRVNSMICKAAEDLAAACHEGMVIDLAKAPAAPDALVRLVSTIAERAKALGLNLLLVAPAETRKTLQDVVETSTIPVYESVDAAQTAGL